MLGGNDSGNGVLSSPVFEGKRRSSPCVCVAVFILPIYRLLGWGKTALLSGLVSKILALNDNLWYSPVLCLLETLWTTAPGEGKDSVAT